MFHTLTKVTTPASLPKRTKLYTRRPYTSRTSLGEVNCLMGIAALVPLRNKRLMSLT